MKIEGEDLKEYHWPYSCIYKADFLAQIISVEKILQKYEGPYEDADPFPYDFDTELDQEIRYCLGIETACLSFH